MCVEVVFTAVGAWGIISSDLPLPFFCCVLGLIFVARVLLLSLDFRIVQKRLQSTYTQLNAKLDRRPNLRGAYLPPLRHIVFNPPCLRGLDSRGCIYVHGAALA